jgi:hypothetical protein
MSIAPGNWSPRRSFTATSLAREGLLTEIVLLLSLGAAVVVIHGTMRWPLELPGHHGVEWMAMLLVGRGLSKQRWGASVASVGAAGCAMLPVWGFGDPIIALTYLVPGLIIDLGWGMAERWQDKAWLFAGMGGLAMATKPLMRWVVNLVTGWPYGSLLYGVLYPTATHILFGVLGALAGYGLLRAARHRSEPK